MRPPKVCPGDPAHLAAARRFNGWVFSAPLAEGHDDLGELPFPHANFHLPEIVGFARAFEVTGNETDAAIARNFFAALTQNHSFCTGGSNTGECWQKPRDLGAFLSTQTQESCTQYNVLKVARHLFTWSADPLFADFYERALLNGVVGNQNRLDPNMTSYIYMLPLGQGNGPQGGVVTKEWGKSNEGFPCCWGTLSESFAKLGDSIYFTDSAQKTVWISQFVTSQVALLDSEITIQQESEFLVSPTKTTSVTVHVVNSPMEFTLNIRVPGWLRLEGKILVNGQEQAGAIKPGAFFQIRRTWHDGDQVDVSFPPSLWVEHLNDFHAEYNATVAFMYGPLVLAGVDIATDIFVPKGDIATPETFIARSSTPTLEFEAVAATGSRMRMIPLRDVVLEHYAVYFMTAGTKPAQRQPLPYCPHSEGLSAAAAASGHGVHWHHTHGSLVNVI